MSSMRADLRSAIRLFNAAPPVSAVVNGLFVSGDFFKTLGVPAHYGRVLIGTDDVRGGGANGPVVVVSDAFWRLRLAGDTHIIGTSLVVEGVSFTIVGVTPREFL